MKDAERSEINRALAKALAYRDCGQRTEVAFWAAKLVELLEVGGILDDNSGAVRRARGED